jgi:hypothetical protein
MSNEAAGLERAAVAMLRTLGAGRASLLVPQPSTTNVQTGLGLSVPMVNEAELEPVLLQTDPPGANLLALVTKGTLQRALCGVGAMDTKQMVEASMLQAGGTQYRIVSVTVKHFGGSELIYELEIEA